MIMRKSIVSGNMCLVTFSLLIFSILFETSVGADGINKRHFTERSTSSSSTVNLVETYSGKGTAWGASWTGGNDWARPADLGLVAMASNHWNSSGICGACLSVTGPGGNSIGIVMDQCPSCEKDSLDLDSASYWSKVSGGKSPGIIDLSWKIVSCGFEKPMVLINKTGVSKSWTSIQVAGANVPVEKLEVSIDEGETWVTMIRDTNDNYFQDNNKGLGEKGDIRVTCINGKQIVTKTVDLTIADTPVNASGNC